MGFIRRLYDWVLHWAETPYGTWALFVLAFCESSFFPVPPDLLLIALAISLPSKSFKYALVCSFGSLLGGIFGYFLGLMFMDSLGFPLLRFYHALDKFEYIQSLYQRYNAWIVGIAGFTPIPYKVFTIAAGACRTNLTVFIVASLISRSARFFLVGGLIYYFGPPVKVFIDKYFNVLVIIFTILFVAGFILLKGVF